MATREAISTISYNTEPFLREHLDRWIKAHWIQSYQYIYHHGEDGDKDHIHLRIEPNRQLDQMQLTEELREYPAGAEKPLGCQPWRRSKEEDWILYVVHDAEYLRTKYNGGDKCEKIPYEWTDIKVSDMYDIETIYLRAKANLSHTGSNLVKRFRQGERAADMISMGENSYLVSSVLRTLNATDYEKLSMEYENLREYVMQLEEAIADSGHEIVISNDGRFVIE